VTRQQRMGEQSRLFYVARRQCVNDVTLKLHVKHSTLPEMLQKKKGALF
jgi:hypothetical protein